MDSLKTLAVKISHDNIPLYQHLKPKNSPNVSRQQAIPKLHPHFENWGSVGVFENDDSRRVWTEEVLPRARIKRTPYIQTVVLAQ